MADETVLRNARLGPGGPVGDLVIAAGLVTSFTAARDRPRAPGHDLSGRTVLPGLWDAHVHLTQWALAGRRVNLTGAQSAGSAMGLMADAARDRGRLDTPLIGYGYRDTFWPDRFDRSMLAWAGSGQPVALVSNDLHGAFLSYAALRRVGRGDHPSGLLVEDEALDAVARLSQVPERDLDRMVVAGLQAAAARGVTGVIDFEVSDTVTDWSRRAQGAPLSTRVACAVYPEFLPAAIDQHLRSGGPAPGGGGLVEVGPLKLFVDGSLNAGTALCHEPYPDETGEGGSGVLQTSPEQLRRLMTEGVRHGILPALHAIGDRAVSVALDAFDHVGCGGRIEHAQLVADRDLPRLARSDLVLGVQPEHLGGDRDVADHRWAGRTRRAFAYAALLRAGARLELGSDAPVSVLDPWRGIATAVHRSDDQRPPWHPEQGISVPDALAAASRGRRTLRAGDPADLVVLDEDPLTLAPHDLREMPVHGTMLGGRWTYGVAFV